MRDFSNHPTSGASTKAKTIARASGINTGRPKNSPTSTAHTAMSVSSLDKGAAVFEGIKELSGGAPLQVAENSLGLAW